jgi:hypothetical protein
VTAHNITNSRYTQADVMKPQGFKGAGIFNGVSVRKTFTSLSVSSPVIPATDPVCSAAPVSAVNTLRFVIIVSTLRYDSFAVD